MNGRREAGRTAARPSRVATAAGALVLGVLTVGAVAGSAGAAEPGAPAWSTTDVGGGRVAAVTLGSTCSGEALARTFPVVGRGHAQGTWLAV